MKSKRIEKNIEQIYQIIEGSKFSNTRNIRKILIYEYKKDFCERTVAKYLQAMRECGIIIAKTNYYSRGYVYVVNVSAIDEDTMKKCVRRYGELQGSSYFEKQTQIDFDGAEKAVTLSQDYRIKMLEQKVNEQAKMITLLNKRKHTIKEKLKNKIIKIVSKW